MTQPMELTGQPGYRGLWRIGPLRRLWQGWERVPPFLKAALSSKGIVHPEGRQLILGKVRRLSLSLIPGVARYVQKRYGIEGACSSCGASCNLMFQCPHWNSYTHLCTVYNDRPSICRTFPITPGDIKDRDIMARRQGRGPCGYQFSPKGAK